MYTYGKATYDEIVERYSVAKAEAIKAMLKGKYTEEGHRITTINETGEGSVEEVLGAYNELFEEWGVIKR